MKTSIVASFMTLFIEEQLFLNRIQRLNNGTS